MRPSTTQSGSHWDVVFDGAPRFTIPDSLGAKYLDYLLHNPNQPISAFDLETTINPEKADVRAKNSIGEGTDAKAAREYLKNLRELRAERDEAQNAGDFGHAEKLDGEIEALERAIKNAPATDTGERARGNVSKAIAAVRRKLSKGEGAQKAFGDFIASAILTGYECTYNEPRGPIWDKAS